MDPKFDAFGKKVAALAPLLRPGALERATIKLMKPRAPVAPRAPMPGPGSFGIATHTKTSLAIEDSHTDSHEDLLPSTFKEPKRKKLAMVHPSVQEVSETMTPSKWKQVFKDVPISVVAGGLGYGIGRTLVEVIGDKVVAPAAASGAARPAWAKALPYALAAASAGGAFAGSRLREGMKRRREAAE